MLLADALKLTLAVADKIGMYVQLVYVIDEQAQTDCE